MRYEEYISSGAWKAKRQERLALDGHKCRLCDEDGTRYRLEVHHRPSSYARMPDESVEDDLITVCSRCHDLITSSIRGDRYEKKECRLEINDSTPAKREEIKYGVGCAQLPVKVYLPDDLSQRAKRRSA